MAETMTEIMNPGTASKESGFPHAPQDWSSDAATSAAQDEGISLSDDHWETIKALQAYFDRSEHPNVRELHDALNEAFHDKGGIKYLYEIFPGGPVAQGCRFAGLKPPAGAVDPSFGSVQ